MSQKDKNPVGGETRQEAKDASAHDKYVHDLMGQMHTVSEHNQKLRAQAGQRIHEASAAVKAAGLRNDGNDDPLRVYHVVQRMLEEKAFYPPHDKRTESPAYAKIHHQMTVVEDQPCLVCKVRQSTLRTPKDNPFGAVQMETHHHTIEWALANAIVPSLFNEFVRPGLIVRAQQRRAKGDRDTIYQEFDGQYGKDMSGDQIKAWIDHSPDNLWVLCDVHHRHVYVGIHAITFPIWGPQDLVDAKIVQMERDTLSAKKTAGHKAEKGKG